MGDSGRPSNKRHTLPLFAMGLRTQAQDALATVGTDVAQTGADVDCIVGHFDLQLIGVGGAAANLNIT